MILAQKKRKIFRTQGSTDESQVQQSGSDEGNAPGARSRRGEAPEQSGQVGGGTAAIEGQSCASHFEVDLLDSWCKP